MRKIAENRQIIQAFSAFFRNLSLHVAEEYNPPKRLSAKAIVVDTRHGTEFLLIFRKSVPNVTFLPLGILRPFHTPQEFLVSGHGSTADKTRRGLSGNAAGCCGGVTAG